MVQGADLAHDEGAWGEGLLLDPHRHFQLVVFAHVEALGSVEGSKISVTRGAKVCEACAQEAAGLSVSARDAHCSRLERHHCCNALLPSQMHISLRTTLSMGLRCCVV